MNPSMLRGGGGQESCRLGIAHRVLSNICEGAAVQTQLGPEPKHVPFSSSRIEMLINSDCGDSTVAAITALISAAYCQHDGDTPQRAHCAR